MEWFVRKKRREQHPPPAFEGQRKREEEADWGIIGLRNDGEGVPVSIMVRGAVKCAICQGFTEDRLVCQECEAAVKYLRSADNLDAFIKLMEVASRPGMLALLETLMHDDILSDMLMQRMENARNRT
jgi:hypothetical protein